MRLKVITLMSCLYLCISCSLNEDAGTDTREITNEEAITDFEGTFVQEDRVGKPTINTMIILTNRKDAFNTTVTGDLQATFATEIEDRIIALSPAYNNATDTNILGMSAAELAALLANDVLTISLTGTTTFFDGTNVLTGRNLEDDVIDTELLLIFGGEDGTENPQLSSDNVNSNDRPFRSTFPYVPKPW